MNVRTLGRASALILILGLAVSAQAQSSPLGQGPPPPPRRHIAVGPDAFANFPGNGFYFSEPLSGVHGQPVTGAPFSAHVVNETVEVLADGNRIDRKSTGTIARDSIGRTRREMTFEAIGPVASAGSAPRLVFISDPAAGKVYTLDETRKTAVVSAPRHLFDSVPKDFSQSRFAGRFAGDTQTESLGQKSIEGIAVQGTRITRTIPAGAIGNEKPIVITIERWYSPDLQTTVQLKRSDPRFGATTYQLTNIDREEPPQSLFMVPSDFTVSTAERPPRRAPPPENDNPGIT